jgi:hypothetical protein
MLVACVDAIVIIFIRVGESEIRAESATCVEGLDILQEFRSVLRILTVLEIMTFLV